MCVRDRLRCSAALGLATAVNESDGRYPQTAAAQAQRQIIAGLSSLGAHEHRWSTTVRDRTARQTEASMNDPAAKVRALYSVPEAMALLNLSRTQIYELVRTSRLVTVTEGRRRLVPAESITDYVQLLLEEGRAGGNGRAA
jgi:excisionase family DNA binding protein